MAIADNHAPPGVVAAGPLASWLVLVPARVGMITRSLGAVISLALLVGVGVWGYRLLVRDMTGVPVVRAMEGPMREAPGAPGVDAVPHLGLSVNEVAAAGQAAPTEDRLLLAPVTPALRDADMLAMSTAEADEPRPADVSADVSSATLAIPVVAIVTGAEPVADPRLLPPATPASVPEATATEPGVTAASPAPLTAEQVLALADQIAAGTTPLAALASGADVPAVVLLDGAVQVAVIDRAVPGVATALIPPSRPARAGIAAATVDAIAGATGGGDDAVATPETAPVLATDLPPGTTLVQLGAYETPQIAAREWAVLSTRFAPFLTGKTRVIQQASSGGRTFFRLRAMGYADMDDARRFCAALAAEEATCIPVPAR